MLTPGLNKPIVNPGLKWNHNGHYETPIQCSAMIVMALKIVEIMVVEE